MGSTTLQWYVTRLKDNALYQARKEFDIPDDSDSGVLKDEQIELSYGKNKSEKHLSRRIAYWDSTNGRLFEFITNNMDLCLKCGTNYGVYYILRKRILLRNDIREFFIFERIPVTK